MAKRDKEGIDSVVFTETVADGDAKPVAIEEPAKDAGKKCACYTCGGCGKELREDRDCITYTQRGQFCNVCRGNLT